MPSGNRERLVDCMEEFVKYTIIMRQHFDLFNDRHSERMERQAKLEKEQIAAQAKATERAGEEGNARTIASAGLVNGIDVGGI
jgi:arsenic resistance protein ArsH